MAPESENDNSLVHLEERITLIDSLLQHPLLGYMHRQHSNVPGSSKYIVKLPRPHPQYGLSKQTVWLNATSYLLHQAFSNGFSVQEMQSIIKAF